LRSTFLSLLILIFIVPVLHAETTHVETEGVGTVVGNDAAAARDKAIEDALRRAVEQTVGTIVESESNVENYQLLSDKIFSHSSGYVSHYDVISENRDGNLLRVKISADVKSDNLQSDLAAIGLLQRRMKYPRVAVMIAENNIMGADTWQMYTVSNSQSEATITARLKEKGFNVVDPGYLRKTVTQADAQAAWQGNNDAAGRVGTKTGAEIVIVGQATSNKAANNIAGSDLLSMTTTLNAQAVKSGTGEVIAQGSGQGTAAHINEVAALQQSLQKASDQAADELISGILQSWQKESSGTRNLSMQLDGASSTDLNKIKISLEKIRGVTEVLVRNFSDGSADLDIQAKTDAQDLSAAIAKTVIPGVKLVLVEASVDRLQYRVAH
jgi:Flagellar assembly protein T, N-terminal domain